MCQRRPRSACCWRDWLSSNKFKIVAQASADGSAFFLGGTDDGAVDFDFTWTVPYTYSRQVTIDQSGPVATATFPVVSRAFEVEAVRNIWAEESTPVAVYTATWARAGPVTARGTEPSEQTVLSRVTVGPHAYGGERLYRDWNWVRLERHAWAAPGAGESFSLVLDPLTQTFSQMLQDATDPVFEVATSLRAESWGSSQSDGPIGLIYDGGEAIACFGLNSPMGSFSSDCWEDSGIFVTGLFQAVAEETVFVESLGGDQWRVVDELMPIPEPATFALMLLGLAGVVVATNRNRNG